MKFTSTLILAATLVSCNAQPRNDGRVFKNIGNSEAKEIIASTPGLQIVDVRQKSELAQGTIEGALHMDISKPDFETQLERLNKSNPVLVYCAAGGRSRSAMEIMEEKGFSVVYNLSTGFEGWRK